MIEGLRGVESIASLCRREGIVANLYYRWSKEFLEAGKKRLLGDTQREASSSEVNDRVVGLLAARLVPAGMARLRAPRLRHPGGPPRHFQLPLPHGRVHNDPAYGLEEASMTSDCFQSAEAPLPPSSARWSAQRASRASPRELHIRIGPHQPAWRSRRRTTP